jgi:membrane protease YdiL (CAAX protease family)
MNWISGMPLLAQLSPEDMEVTPGRLAASGVILLVICGSIFMMALWGIRRVNKGEFLPLAKRKTMYIPQPLSVIAIVWAVLFAAVVILSSTSTREAQPFFEDESNVVAEGGEDGNGAADDSEAADDSAGEAEAGDGQDEAPEKQLTPEEKAAQRKEMLSLLATNMVFQSGLFALFGLVVLVIQYGKHRYVHQASDSGASVGYLTGRPHEQVAASVADQNVWHDLDEEPPEAVGPAETPPETLDEVADEDFIDEDTPLYAADNPFAISSTPGTGAGISAATTGEGHVYEPWHLWTELRFAAEVFLVAFLPTMVLRIVMVMLLNDVSSHPFLEMLSDGANWDIMLLILLMAVVVAPISEELIYRVIILGGMAQAGYQATGWTVASILFALAHGFPDCVALLPLSFVLGYTYFRRRSYRTVVLVHFLFNSFNMVLALLALI